MPTPTLGVVGGDTTRGPGTDRCTVPDGVGIGDIRTGMTRGIGMIPGGGTTDTCPTVPVAESHCRRPTVLRAATRAIRHPATTGDRVRAWKTPEVLPAASAILRTETVLRKAYPPASKATNAAPPPATADRPSACRDRVPRLIVGENRPPRPSATGSVRDMKTSEAEVRPLLRERFIGLLDRVAPRGATIGLLPRPTGRVRAVLRGVTAGLPHLPAATRVRLGIMRAPRPLANTTRHPLRAVTTCLRPLAVTLPPLRRGSGAGVPPGGLHRADSAAGKHHLKKDSLKKLCKRYHDFSARLHSALPPCSWEVPWRGKA